MKILLSILLVMTTIGDLDKIATINKMKKEAKEAYNNGNYELAAKNYQYLLDSLEVTDENIELNLANAYFKMQDSTRAMNTYSSIAGSEDAVIRSVAQQQLGIMANRNKKFEEALDHFKNALKADPSNEDARYNYELLKKVLDEQQKQDSKNKDNQQDKKDQQKKDQKDQKDNQSDQQQNKNDQQKKEDKNGDQSKDQKSDQKEQRDEDSKEKGDQKKEDQQKSQEEKDAEKSDQQKPEGEPDQKESDKQKNDKLNDSVAEKLKDMKISEEKARMILEAMKNNEIQYIQQNKRKATRKKDNSRPDW